MENPEKKIYKDAAKHEFWSSFLNRNIALFLLAFIVAIVFLPSVSIIKLLINDFSISRLIFNVIWFSIIFGFIYFLFHQLKKLIYKIEIDNNGVTFFGLMNENFILWQNIISIKPTKSISDRGKAIVHTKNGDFEFRLTMNEEGVEFPKFSQDFKHGSCWIDTSSKSYPINSENCQPYVEIEKRIKINVNKT